MEIKTDVLIIGTGIAGCCTALELAKRGIKVLLITKMPDPELTNTTMAQGGIIYKGKNDSPEKLASDIKSAGAGLCYEPAVYFLAEKGPELVEKLLINELKVPFDRNKKSELDLTEEGAHSVPRIIHYKDWTGKVICDKLIRAVKGDKNITLLKNSTAIDLLTLSHHSKNPNDIYKLPTCVGAYVLNSQTGKVNTILAKETVLATGGVGRLFLHTTNPLGARGDGIAMAYRAGARLLNLEFIQFHPTTLYHREAERFLLSESMRGEGAVIINKYDEKFMQRYHKLGSMAPRDVVARAIYEEMIRTKDECVYLDISFKDKKWIKQRFPNIYQKCLEYDINITKHKIPIVPSAHYSCGGVAVDLYGRTSINRLRAVGEVSCTGVHGANRLASTSLLEGLVWGWSTAQDIATESKGKRYYFPEIEPWQYENEPIDPADIHQDWLIIKHTMWNYVGLVRSLKRMKRAIQILKELQNEIENFYDKGKLSDELIGVRNAVQSALAILYAAHENRESRGCHYLSENE